VASVALRLLPTLPPRAQPPAVADDADPVRAAIGRAVHRCLEWYRPGDDLAALAHSAAAEFGADAETVYPVAKRIVSHPDTAPLFDATRLHWAGNEVSVGDAGRTQRIDRLVLLEADGRRTWWVLDYKLRHDPQALEAYRSQLLAYRALVQRAQPGDEVRCAFIAGSGERIEIAPGSRS
jgi:ATP-dependent helicase/nuclease subunit A